MDYDSGQCMSFAVEHLVGLDGYNCLLLAARNKATSKLHLFLVFKAMGKIFQRYGRYGVWEEIKSTADYARIKYLTENAQAAKRVPVMRNISLRPFLLREISKDDLLENFGKAG